MELGVLQAVLVQNCEGMTLTDLNYNVKLWYLNPYNPVRDTVYVGMFLIQEVPEQLMVGDQEHSQEVLQILTLFLCCSRGGYGIGVSG